MISEKKFSAIFSGFWEECLPLLTPSFVRLFNEAYSLDLTELPSTKFKQIEIGSKIEKYDLVAEFAFCLAELALVESDSVLAFKDNMEFKNLAYSKAIDFLANYKDAGSAIVLNDSEVMESFTIAEQYGYFFDYLGGDQIEFRPQVIGAGFLGSCKADISVSDTLYEVKTVSRNLGGRDIRQLLTYLALQSSSGVQRWANAGFFNPRKAIQYKFSVDHLIYRTSGGRSTTEVFHDVVDFLADRNIEIDTIF